MKEKVDSVEGFKQLRQYRKKNAFLGGKRRGFFAEKIHPFDLYARLTGTPKPEFIELGACFLLDGKACLETTAVNPRIPAAKTMLVEARKKLKKEAR